QFPQDARAPGITSGPARRLGQALRTDGGGRRAALAHARRSHPGGKSLPRSAARWGSREVMGTELLGLDEHRLLKGEFQRSRGRHPGTTWWRLPSRVPSRVPRVVLSWVGVKL